MKYRYTEVYDIEVPDDPVARGNLWAQFLETLDHKEEANETEFCYWLVCESHIGNNSDLVDLYDYRAEGPLIPPEPK